MLTMWPFSIVILVSDVIDNVLVNVKKVPREYMASNEFDEYLVQVEHDFEGLRREAKQLFLLIFCDLRTVVPSTMAIW